MSWRNQSGFTLIEILVALTIMSFMMVSIYQVVDNNFDTKDEVLKEDKEYLSVYTALSRIERDLSQYYTPRYHSAMPQAANGANGSAVPTPAYANQNQPTQNVMPINRFFPAATKKGHPIPLFDRIDKNEIMFMTSGHKRFIQGQKQSRYAWVKYFVREPDDDEESLGDGLNLYRQTITENIYDPNMDITKARETLILTGVKSLMFYYWDIKRRRWVETFEYDKQPPPLAFRFIIEHVDGQDVERTFEKIVRPYWPVFDPEADNAPATPTPGQPATPTTPAPATGN